MVLLYLFCVQDEYFHYVRNVRFHVWLQIQTDFVKLYVGGVFDLRLDSVQGALKMLPLGCRFMDQNPVPVYRPLENSKTIMNKLSMNRSFHYVFTTVVCFTFISGSCSVWLANQKSLSREQIRVFETCNATWNMGIGAIFGLLGSKATELFQTETELDEESEE